MFLGTWNSRVSGLAAAPAGAGSEVPAEVDLGLADLLTVECEHLGVAESAPVGLRAQAGDHDLIASLREARELEASISSEFGQQRSKYLARSIHTAAGL
jgi:hypothetical protein